MGCIIDWTGVLKAPQIITAGRAKNYEFRPKRRMMTPMA